MITEEAGSGSVGSVTGGFSHCPRISLPKLFHLIKSGFVQMMYQRSLSKTLRHQRQFDCCSKKNLFHATDDQIHLIIFHIMVVSLLFVFCV